jgi:NAD+ kinase
MPAARNIAFLASETDLAEEAKARLEGLYGRFAPEEADVIVALGGDGFMLLDAARHAGDRGPGLRHEPRHGRLPDERLSRG